MSKISGLKNGSLILVMTCMIVDLFSYAILVAGTRTTGLRRCAVNEEQVLGQWMAAGSQGGEDPNIPPNLQIPRSNVFATAQIRAGRLNALAKNGSVPVVILIVDDFQTPDASSS